MGWTKDNEERSAIAKKAHDAYAIGRQALGKIEAAEATNVVLRAELDDLRATLTQVRGALAALARTVTKLEAQFAEATEPAPRPAPLKRKAA